MPSTWLKDARGTAWTQEALANALGVNVKTVKRLEGCGADTPQQVRYAELARALDVCPIQLAEHHARDLAANRQPDHAARALGAADRLRRERQFPPADSEPIRWALEACRASGLIDQIAAKSPDLGDPAAQAAGLARSLDAGDLDGLSRILSKALTTAIDAAGDRRQLDALAELVRTLVRLSAAHDAALGTTGAARPGWHQHHGEPEPWQLTALVDRSCGLDGLRWVRPAAGNEPRIDPASPRALCAGPVTTTDADQRVYELVLAFADFVGFDGDKPAPGDDNGLADYCKRVNQMIWGLGDGDDHVLGYFRRIHQEPDTIKDRLLAALPDLRLFDTGDPGRANSVLRVDGGKLGTWLAMRLQAIADRRKVLPASPVHAHPPTTPTETRPMTNDQGSAPINVHVNVNSGGGNVNQAAGGSQAHQHNLSAPAADLLAVLEQLLAETSGSDPRHGELRQACREAQGELERQQALTLPTKTRLQRAAEAIESWAPTDRLLGMAANLSELLSRLPAIGP